MNYTKLIRDGNVAVVYSTEGVWSTLYLDYKEIANFLMFDEKVVAIVERYLKGDEDIDDLYLEMLAVTEYRGTLITGLNIAWIPLGTPFTVVRGYHEEIVVSQLTHTA